jgi:hypothetical protein
MPWFFLGKGTYNKVFTDAKNEPDRRFVSKVQLNVDASTRRIDLPERSVRLWNLINPDISPPATVEVIDYINETGEKVRSKAWKCPYIRGRQATDHEIACELVRIFNTTGRIIMDAISPRNFIHTAEGRTVCVDVGMALELEHRDEAEVVSSSAPHLRRQKSAVSLEGWQTLHNDYIAYFAHEIKRYPETIKTIQALLFIKNNSIDIYHAGFLQAYPLIRRNLGNAYIAQQILQLSMEVLTQLNNISVGHPQTKRGIKRLETLNKHCLELINDYLSELSLSTDRSHELALSKVQMNNLRLAFSELSPASLTIDPLKTTLILANMDLRRQEAIGLLQGHIDSAIHDLAPFNTRNSEPAGAGAGTGASASASASAGSGYDSASSGDTIIHVTSTKHPAPVSLELQRMKVSCGALIQSYMHRMREAAANKGKPKAILRAANENLEAGKKLLRLFDTSESLREVQQSVSNFRPPDPDLAYVKKQCSDILECKLTL